MSRRFISAQLLALAALVYIPSAAYCQSLAVRANMNPFQPAAAGPSISLRGLSFPALALPDSPPNSSATSGNEEHHGGLIGRGITRILHDQGSLYAAPFKPANYVKDFLVLAPTGVLLVVDRHIDNSLPGGNLNRYSVISNVAIGTMAGALATTWIYGLKTDNPHAEELGKLEVESLVNTFLIYTPMQFIAGRQRPGEGNGHGDFLRHHAMNTSFPAGHAMFTWAMAATAAHEYPKTWVKILAYGGALAVSSSRFLGRDHWASDTFIGSALGYFIGAHVFHTRCDAEYSKACHHSRDED